MPVRRQRDGAVVELLQQGECLREMHVHVATSSARDKPNRRGGHGASGGGVNTAPTLRYAAAPNQKTEESRCGASYSGARSEEHTSELQSLMRISYAVFCLKKKNTTTKITRSHHHTHLICSRHTT